jgi:hypothetical protein
MNFRPGRKIKRVKIFYCIYINFYAFTPELRKLKMKHWLLFSHTQDKDDDEIIKLLDDSGCKKLSHS